MVLDKRVIEIKQKARRGPPPLSPLQGCAKFLPSNEINLVCSICVNDFCLSFVIEKLSLQG